MGRTRTFVTRLAAVAAAAVLVSCSGGQPPTPTSGGTPAPTRGSGGQPPSPTSAATTGPSPTVATPAVYPPGTRTGIAIVGRFLGAVEAHDSTTLLSLLQYQPIRCTNAVMDIYPSCPPPAPEGSPVDSILSERCDAGWIPRDVDLAGDMSRYLHPDLALFAVAAWGTSPVSANEGGPPAGKYYVVLAPTGTGHDAEPDDAEPRAAVLTDSGIVAYKTGCNQQAVDLLKTDAANRHFSVLITSFILPPK